MWYDLVKIFDWNQTFTREFKRERERERERALNPDVVLNTLIPIGKSYFDNNKNKIVEAHSDLVMK